MRIRWARPSLRPESGKVAAAFLVLALGAPSCKSEAQKQAERERIEEVARLEAAAKERARQEKFRAALLANPAAYFEHSEERFADQAGKGRELVELSLFNKSNVAVRDVKGTIDWFDAKDVHVGAVSFSVKGTIPAGNTRHFTVTNGTLESPPLKAAGARFKLQVASLTPILPE